MLTFHMASDFCSPVPLFLVNLAIVAVLVGAMSLLACNLFCRRRLPLRYLMLLGGLVALLASPILIAAIEWNGFSLIGVVRDSQSVPSKDVERPMAENSAAPEHLGQIVRGRETDSRDATSVTHISNRHADIQSALSTKPQVGSAASHRASALETPASQDRAAWNAVWWVTFVLAAIWLAGICYQLYWMQKGLRGVNQLRRSVRPIDDSRISRFAHVAAKAVGLRVPAVRPVGGDQPAAGRRDFARAGNSAL